MIKNFIYLLTRDFFVVVTVEEEAEKRNEDVESFLNNEGG